MKRFLRLWFTYNRRERNGVYILLLLIFTVLAYSWRRPCFDKIEDTELNAAITILERRQVKKFADGQEKKLFMHRRQPKVQQIRLHQFDPNTAGVSELTQLGFSEKQAMSIQRFVKHGGVFRKKEDFRKIYCVSDDKYFELEPFIEIIRKVKGKTPEKNEKKTLIKVDINIADSLDLLNLKGIGPFYAGHMLRYRDELGGFVGSQQLLEMWKFDSVKLNKILPQIEISQGSVQKININSCSAEELKHPYLTWVQVNGIINYRQHHGKFVSVEDLLHTDLVNEETLRKIAPYLTIGQ